MTPAGARIRVLLVGYGRMGRMVEQLADDYGVDIVGHLTRDRPSDTDIPSAEVAIDFSTAEAVVRNAPRLAALGMSLVIGTTGWQASEAKVRDSIEQISCRAHCGAELCHRGECVFDDLRARRRLAGAPQRIRAVDPRSAPRGQEGCPFRHRDCSAAPG